MNENRDELEEQLRLLTAQFVEEAGKVHPSYDDLAQLVYSLFDEILFSANLDCYMRSCVSALGIIAIHKESLVFLREQMGEEDFDNLCQLLQKMAIFCYSVRTSDICLARLERIKWDTVENSSLPINAIKKLIREYKQKLNNLKEDMQLKKK